MVLKPTVGLEIHIELNTRSKMFCECKNDPDQIKPNINVCPICMANPGALPVINQEAVEKTIKTALALGCSIAEKPFFERKNYFYPDLPKGYQISQYQSPIGRNGALETESNMRVRIERVHLEEDTGKLLHIDGQKNSLVDFNRAGVSLMEIVTEPDISSVKESREFIKELQTILRYLDVSFVNMEKGEMRVEVNVSLAFEDAKELGVKVEIKNLNSIRAVEKSIEYEVIRQSEILNKGDKVVQETRGFHDQKEITFSQRKKEEAHDYRYFPEPDLPPLDIKKDILEKIKAEIPELPNAKRKRLRQEYGLSDQDVNLYVLQRDLGEYFEKTISELMEWASAESITNSDDKAKLTKLTTNYIATDLQALLKGGVFQQDKFLITPENFAEFIVMIFQGKISSKIAKTVLLEMFEKGSDPSQIVDDKGLTMITNDSQIEQAALVVIKQNPEAAQSYKKGKETALQFLIGQVMKETKGRAEPGQTAKILKQHLKQN